MSYIVATDVGGTCTDTVIAASDGTIHIGKVLSTAPDFAVGVIESIQSATAAMGITNGVLFANTDLFVHGSTVVDNTLLTSSGSHTGLITTRGFEDTLRVTRGAYGRWSGLPEDQIKHPVATDRPPPLVDIARICGVPERIDYKGAIIEALDLDVTKTAIEYLLNEQQVTAIAVCLLWSFRNPLHELAIKDLINELSPACYVSLSSEIAPLPGEYERTSTTAINAYAGTVVKNYMDNLQSLLTAEGYLGPVLVMQGHGGLMPVAESSTRAVGMIECGPVAGLIGSRHLGQLLDEPNIIAVDMGGTTSKVGVIQNGALDYAREPMVNRYHYLAPKIEVASIGAGGGSIIELEPGSLAPRVGPQSAGSRPGPVCYGNGATQPTLTDVMLLIGYMHPEHFLGGTIALDRGACVKAFETTIAKPLGMSLADAAFGIFRIACSQMSDLIHEITVERGLDPRDYVLHAFGGTCPMLAAVFGRELNVSRIVVPYTAAVNCAFGLVASDVVHEYTATTLVSLPAAAQTLNAQFEPLVSAATEALLAEGFAEQEMRIDCAVAMRYGLQVHELGIPLARGFPLCDADVALQIEAFERLYEQRYGKGSAYREAGVELTQFRVTGRGLLRRPELVKSVLGNADASAAQIGTREILVEAQSAFALAPIYDFVRLKPGNVIAGPAVIHAPVTTIVLQDAQIGRIDEYMNTVIEFE
jgi:N-methylhydantoinase A